MGSLNIYEFGMLTETKQINTKNTPGVTKMPDNSTETSTNQIKTSAKQLEFSGIGKMRVQAVFDEPALSSDGGAILIREAAEINGIIDAMASAITDERDQTYVRHTMTELLNQRVTQICHGYEDANDCDTLRDDLAFMVAAGRKPDDDSLASQPTMSRLENGVGMRDLLKLFSHRVPQQSPTNATRHM